MPDEHLTHDLPFERGDAVNWMGCNGYVTALIVLDGAVLYEVQFMNKDGELCVWRFQHFELSAGHAV